MRVGIINYGRGNVGSVSGAFKRVRANSFLISEAGQIEDADCIVLPGVGQFAACMKAFAESGLREGVEKAVLERRVPVLGICVGMQMLADFSQEGDCEGLGWIPGTVDRFSKENQDAGFRTPHVGWATIDHNEQLIFAGIPTGSRFYFTHSYYFVPELAENSIAVAKNGIEFTCVVQADNILGVQFHPERSHKAGLQLLANFSGAAVPA